MATDLSEEIKLLRGRVHSLFDDGAECDTGKERTLGYLLQVLAQLAKVQASLAEDADDELPKLADRVRQRLEETGGRLPWESDARPGPSRRAPSK